MKIIKELYYIPLYILAFIFLMIILDFIFIIYKHYKIKKDIENKLNKFCNNRLSSLTIVKNKSYEYILELKTSVYLIKLIPNYRQKELIVYSKDGWYFRSKNGLLKTLDLKEFMDEEYEVSNHKKLKKLLVIYPECLNMVHYNGEYDIEIIFDELELYGLYTITSSALLNKEEIE